MRQSCQRSEMHTARAWKLVAAPMACRCFNKPARNMCLTYWLVLGGANAWEMLMMMLPRYPKILCQRTPGGLSGRQGVTKYDVHWFKVGDGGSILFVHPVTKPTWNEESTVRKPRETGRTLDANHSLDYVGGGV